MEVRIVQLLQQMSFQTRKTVTYVVLELPDGNKVHAAIDEEAASAIIRADVESNGTAPTSTTAGEALSLPPEATEEEVEPPSEPAPTAEVVSETETEQVRVFGGESPTQAGTPAARKKGGGGKKKKAQAAPPPSPEPPAPVPTPAPEPRVAPKYPEPLSTKSYKKMVADGVLPENAYFRTVPAVAGGYPAVMVTEGTADPDTVTGKFNRDEDGVGSV